MQPATEVTRRVDPTLLAEMRRYGNIDTSACLNCGGCTVVCDLSNPAASFPRKPIRLAILGLRESVLESLEPWLCHDCGQCTTTCPRQTEPAESMRTIRRYLAARYDWTGLSSKILTSKAWHVGSLAIVGLTVFLLALLYHLYYVKLPVAELTSTAMGFEHMFSTILYFTAVVYLLPMFFILSHTYRMFRFTMRGGQRPRRRLYATELKTVFVQMLTHQRMFKCPGNLRRWATHWLMALSCVVMFVLTFFFLRWFQTDSTYPLYHPQRWVGYLVTAILVYATAEIIIGRIRKKKEIYKFSETGDLTLPVLLLGTALTGIAAHIFRYTGLYLTAHYTYALHLMVSVPMLVIEVPFGKWSHMMYRPMAIYLQTVREKSAAEIPAEAALEPLRT